MYGKLFERAFTGSMFGCGPVVFAVWAYIIAFTAEDHHVELNPALIAATLGCGVDEVNQALTFLQSPDPKSRCKDNGGARIVPLEPGSFTYFVTTHEAYRGIKDNDELREYNREAKARSRAKLASTAVNPDVKRSRRMSIHTEAEAEADTEAETEAENRDRGRRFAPPSPAEVRKHAEGLGYHNFDAEGFCSFYESKGWVVGRSPMRSWKAAVVSWHRRDEDFGRDSAAAPKSNVRFNPDEDRKRADWIACEAIQAQMEKRKPRPYPED